LDTHLHCVVRRCTGGINQQSWQSELKELEANLALSTAPWKIVIGHHPVFSSGSGHGGSPDLITNLNPILQQYGAQVMFRTKQSQVRTSTVTWKQELEDLWLAVSWCSCWTLAVVLPWGLEYSFGHRH
jgi:hypothetical protein